MKKVLALALTLIMTLSLAACGGNDTTEETGGEETGGDTSATTISLWSFNIGGFTDAASWDSLIAAFNEQYPDITVEVNPINYQDGDSILTSAISSGNAPDIIFEGPERVVGTMPVRV